MCQSFSKKLPSPFPTPKAAGTCPMMIVSARPMMKPLSTGSEMNEARNPSRARPAARQRRPVTSATAVVRVTNSASSPLAKTPTTLADRAAVADMGPTIRWRELPNAA